MLSRRLARAVVLGATLCLMTLGVDVASAAPSTAPGSSPQAAAADTSLMADCFLYKGERRGCTYYNPSNSMFRTCDYPDPGGVRRTIGRLSINGDLVFVDYVSSPSPQPDVYCDGSVQYPVGAGDRVCIHTGVEGLGWTTAECRTFAGPTGR